MYCEISFIPVIAKLNFQQPFLKCHMIFSKTFYNPSEIIFIWWFDVQETFLVVINTENFIHAAICVQSIGKQKWLSTYGDILH